jgi:SAM-dependent methyltransferase
MKRHAQKYYEQLYRGEKGAGFPGLGGRILAVELGYPAGIIDGFPDEIWKEFLSCGNVLPFLHPKPRERVLNLGCGAGVDSIALKLLAGDQFAVVNLDVAALALLNARGRSKRFFPGFEFEFVCADGDSLPFKSNSFEWIILNGVFNLFPEKGELIVELNRVLKPDGVVAGADLCRRAMLPDYFASEPDAWAWCMSGALN